MNLGSTDPLSSKARHNARTFTSLFALVALFLVLVSILSWILSRLFSSWIPMLVTDALVLCLCYYLYLVWHGRAIRIRCDGCKNIILSNTPWVCGECGQQHINAKQNTILDECSSCGNAPKSYLCHYCGEHVFFSEDMSRMNPATALESSAQKNRKLSRKIEKHQETRQDREHHIELVELDVIEARLNARVKAIEALAVDKSANSLLDAERQNLKEFMEGHFAVDEALRQQKAANAIECKDDSTERRRRDKAAEKWRRHKLGEE